MSSNLLKFARARDDQDFGWRIAAAMQVRAQEIENWELSAPSRAFTGWVLNNPMVPHERMTAFVSTSPAIAENITVESGAVSTAGVPDDDLQFVVNEVWDRVAESLGY
jgi:hypothetical protein